MMTVATQHLSPGKTLAAFLDNMNVERLWLADFPIDWRLGIPTGPRETTPGGHTHCSAFAAAVADRLGIYILRPPEHGQNWLANAQERWLNGFGMGRFSARECGWRKLGTNADVGASERAIDHAQQGHLVVAIYFQPPKGKTILPGHIAIVRPEPKTARRLREEGPNVIQAATHNRTDVPMRDGFINHRMGWAMGQIEYFSAPTGPWSCSPSPRNNGGLF